MMKFSYQFVVVHAEVQSVDALDNYKFPTDEQKDELSDSSDTERLPLWVLEADTEVFVAKETLETYKYGKLLSNHTHKRHP